MVDVLNKDLGETYKKRKEATKRYFVKLQVGLRR
jgi:hypothetical protein